MKMASQNQGLAYVGALLLPVVLLMGATAFLVAFAQESVSTEVVVGNAPPSVTAVTLNNGNLITLVTNVTTTFNINYTVSDNNGCGDVFASTSTFAGISTSTAFRNGVASVCALENPIGDDLNCYIRISHVNGCTNSSTVSVNATDTIEIFYFAQSTNGASSSFPSDHWEAYALVTDFSGASSSATSSAVELDVLLAINLSTSTFNYGPLSASSTTGVTNQIATTTNTGNSTTTYSIRASATLTKGVDSIATSSQRWATSTFDMDNLGPGTSTALTDSNVNVPDHLSLPATTTVGALGLATFFGLTVPAGTATGSYNGATEYIAVFVE